jgi:anti-sigma regulatory factor (Ser/Thr protein kinase)
MKGGAAGNTRRVPLAPAHHDLIVGLPVDPKAARAARRVLVREGLDADLDHTVCLLVSELVTNSVRHAGMRPEEKIVLAARLTADFARIEVRDTGPGFDASVRHQAAGYGLRMLDALTTRWGVDRDAAGTRVWFEIDRRRRRFGRD